MGAASSRDSIAARCRTRREKPAKYNRKGFSDTLKEANSHAMPESNISTNHSTPEVGMKKIGFSQLVIFAAVLGMLGCTNPQRPPAIVAASSINAPASTPFQIQTGDELDIKFFYNPELNETVTVRPDGFISLQLVDEVKAAGLQPKELDDLLTRLYAVELKKPVITVIIRSFTGQRVYVGGEVTTQGLITIPGRISALQAVMQAGGFRVTAQPSETLVIRKGPDRRPIPIQVDLDAVINGGEGAADFMLQPEDVVYVPKSPIAKANQFVNQYIENLLLFRGVTFGFVYDVD
ncbi:MAG: polysaccharide export protein [Desulfobacterales bacterium]|nr:polysaccharide export protein [Desulfobacterales bacterium]